MTRIRKAHQKPYRQRSDLQERLESLKQVIEYLRDCDLVEDSKKRMLNHAVWEVTIALGDFTPEFRSRSVIEGSIGTKIQREHVYQRKKIVADILSKGESLDCVISRVVHCVVTKEEHEKLKSIPATEDGWNRYRLADIEVFRCSDEKPKKYEPN